MEVQSYSAKETECLSGIVTIIQGEGNFAFTLRAYAGIILHREIEGLVHVPLLPRAQEDNQQHHSYYDYTNNFKGHGSGHAVHKGKISIMMTMQNDNEYINPN